VAVVTREMKATATAAVASTTLSLTGKDKTLASSMISASTSASAKTVVVAPASVVVNAIAVNRNAGEKVPNNHPTTENKNSSNNSRGGERRTVIIDDFDFNVQQLTVPVFSTIEFKLADDVPHHAEHEIYGSSRVKELRFEGPLLQVSS
jgi:hypothetical protein